MKKIDNSGCFVNGGLPWNKGLTKDTDSRLRKPTKYSMHSEPYIRNCPNCGIELKYSTVYYFVNALNNNRQCNKCANTGKGWQTGKYGYERTDVINKKSSESHMGISYGKLSDEHKQKISESNKGKIFSKEVKKKMRISAINRIEERAGQLMPNYNTSSILILEQKAKELGITDLQHAENGGEYHIKELGYWVDGYSKEKNIVIEYYEKHHNKQKERDSQRQTEITEFLKCEFIILKEI
jgi:hypothetical protein